MIDKQTRPPITHVAIRYNDQIWSLPKPHRHQDIFRVIMYLNPEIKCIPFLDDDDYGFLDEKGKYLRRHSAKINAILHGQIKDDLCTGRFMKSEDLW